MVFWLHFAAVVDLPAGEECSVLNSRQARLIYQQVALLAFKMTSDPVLVSVAL